MKINLQLYILIYIVCYSFSVCQDFFVPPLDTGLIANQMNIDHGLDNKLQYDFFYQKDLNWFYKPQNYIIDNFVKRDYDILINLCDSSCIPIK